MSKKYVERFSSKFCYQNIDYLPVYNWFKFHETRDSSYLLIKKRAVSKKEEVALSILWEKIYDQYLVMFGFSENYLNIMQKEKKIIGLKIRLITENNLSLWTWIDIAEIELEELKAKTNKGEKITFYDMAVEIEKFTRVPIDEMKVSVSKFYSSLKSMDKYFNSKAA